MKSNINSINHGEPSDSLPMKVLVACEYSGIVREAFKAKGHDAWSCDLLPTEIPGQHIQGDVLEILRDDWDLIIAHPPCTYLSNAGAARLYPKKGVLNQERYKKGLEAKWFFMEFYDNLCSKIAIENPVHTKVFGLPKYNQIIQPYEHGHPYSKKTCLWLKGLPEIKPTEIVTENIISWVSGGSKNDKGNPRKQSGTKFRDSKTRSRTFQGIADAMAEQWGVND